MKNVFRKISIVLLAIVCGIPSMWAQDVNMSRYITMNVKSRKQIYLKLCADVPDTKIKLVSGFNEKTITVNDTWTEWQDFKTDGDVMTIYGDVQKLDCSNNMQNITGMETKNNAQLQELHCYANSIASLDLSQNTQLKVLGCFNNSLNSLDVSKNLQLMELDCSENKISVLDVSNNSQLSKLFCLKNSIASLDIDNDTQLKVLDCSENKIESLDVSKNVLLEKLNCYKNLLNALDVTKNVELAGINCSGNKIKVIDVSKNTKLEWLYSFDNPLGTLDVSKNTILKNLRCYNNNLTSLDVSNNLELEWLYCNGNSLESIDVSQNTELKDFVCHDNKFTTETIDDIFCSLPERNGHAAGRIAIVSKSSSDDNSVALAANGNNAISKNWRVVYYFNNTEITGFTGTKQCTNGIYQTENNSDVTIYPNPVKDVLHITSDKPINIIRIFNVSGAELLRTANTNSVNVSHLPAGIYMVYVNDKPTKIIKE